MAKYDLLWLGEDPDNYAKPAFEIIIYIANVWHHVYDENNKPLSTASNDDRRHWKDIPETFEVSFDIIKRALGDPPVWQRIWIIQEIAAARHVYLHFGSRSIPWTILENFDKANRDSFQPILKLWDDFNDCFATDPRDMIFALLGLAYEASRAIMADYTKSREEVFTMISASKLPSWVVDFSSHNEGRYLPSIAVSDHAYKASGSTFCFTIKADVKNPSSLVLNGIMLDTITQKFELDTTQDTLMEKFGFSPDEPDSRIQRLKISITRLTALIWELPEWIFDTNARGAIMRESRTGHEKYAKFRSAGTYASSTRAILDNKILANKEMIRELGDLLFLLRESKAALLEGSFQEVFQDERFLEALEKILVSIVPEKWNYEFFVGEGGCVGMVPYTARVGDVVVVLFGAKVPLVLRGVEGGKGRWELVGTSYVDGFMYGEAIELRDAGLLKHESVCIIGFG
ncbi:uncharacterized protein PAC_16525 [Phialocephala subalpina]|uniref:Heterokaryon incompatibility domain-containing protein n=1 Tax=Phialocephala subalpina TaxID=576137 RepID=A0A1L7XNN4_9HELO|nr:uncharacterized protein PAC_16525 [Phialocephala subalpina]